MDYDSKNIETAPTDKPILVWARMKGETDGTWVAGRAVVDPETRRKVLQAGGYEEFELQFWAPGLATKEET